MLGDCRGDEWPEMAARALLDGAYIQTVYCVVSVQHCCVDATLFSYNTSNSLVLARLVPTPLHICSSRYRPESISRSLRSPLALVLRAADALCPTSFIPHLL